MARTTSQPRPHALAQALHRSAGFALLWPASRPRLDVARILTMSGTLAINLIALGMLMMPLAMPPPATWVEPTARHPVRDIVRDKPVVVETAPVTVPTAAPQPLPPLESSTPTPPRKGPIEPMPPDMASQYSH